MGYLFISSVFSLRERAKIILDSLLNELDNKDVPGHERRCVPHLAECLYHIIDSQNDILMDATNKIMLKTRSRSSKACFCKCLSLCTSYSHRSLRPLQGRSLAINSHVTRFTFW